MTSYYSHFDEILEDKHEYGFLGKIGFMSRFFGKVILNSVEPSRKKKIKTFPIWDPKKSELSSEVFTEFETAANKTKEYIDKLSSKFNGKTMIASPANKKIVYPLEFAMEIITQHNFRHLNQANEVKTEIESNI